MIYNVVLVSGAGQSDSVIFKKLRSWIPVPSLHGKQKGEKKSYTMKL